MSGGIPNLPKARPQLKLGEVLTNKEADTMLPKVKEVLMTVFEYLDKGITLTNRERAVAEIWSDITDKDLEILATHLVEAGKSSRIVATGVRKIVQTHRLLQIGLITVPRFIQTVSHYQQHGGFALPFNIGGAKNGQAHRSQTHQPEQNPAYLAGTS